MVSKDTCPVVQRNLYETVVAQFVVLPTSSASDSTVDIKGSIVKTATSQNGDTETATEMAIFKSATNPNNTYNSIEV